MARCIVCGASVAQRTRGRCRACYEWWLRHGRTAERPATLDLPLVRPCGACGEVRRIVTRGHCQRCHSWSWRHGGAEPPGVPCRRCEQCQRVIRATEPAAQTRCVRCAALRDQAAE